MPEKSLAGKTAVITGAAKRLGRAIALALANDGADIVVHYRSSAGEAAGLCSELSGLGVRSWALKADFEKPEEYEPLIARAKNEAGKLDILVNSASIFPPSALNNLDFNDLVRNVRVNAWVPFVLSREFARVSARGKIINMLDSRIIGYDWTHVSYILSKHMLSVLTKMMAIEFAPGIAVNGIAPGLILPPPGKDQSFLERMAPSVPLKRHGDPGDIVDAVMYLLKSDFVTGEVINVDGGRHIMEHKMETKSGPHPDKRP